MSSFEEAEQEEILEAVARQAGYVREESKPFVMPDFSGWTDDHLENYRRGVSLLLEQAEVVHDAICIEQESRELPEFGRPFTVIDGGVETTEPPDLAA